jgi:hypothetical protein
VAIGHIKTVSVVDGQYEITVDTGSGPAVTATLMFPPGIDAKPLAGDAVRFSRNGQEIAITGLFTEDVQADDGEAILFSRSGDGSIVASVWMKKDGSIEILPDSGQVAGVGDASDFVAMAAKTDAKVDAIVDAITNAAVGGAPDAGAAFKANMVSLLGVSIPAIGSVASANLKAD